MKRLFGGKSILCLALACAFLACAFLACAPISQGESTAHIQKHARKVQKRLAKYPSGSYVHLLLRDDTQSYGSLGALSPVSFRFTNADTNLTTTYAYTDVDKVRTDKEFIGEGTAPERHIRHLVPILVGVAAAGGAAAYLELR